MNVKEIKRICKKNNFVPLRRRGQNFLINPKFIKRIIDITEIDKKDVILEIGSGLGALTEEIVDKCKRLIAVEIDQKLVQILRERLKGHKNVEIIRDSILDGISNLNIKEKKYKVISNLPFNITGRVLRILLRERDKLELIVVVVQKEVAQRIIAQPPYMSLLSLSIQFYSQVQAVFDINRSNFWPQPRVDSIVLKIKPNESKIKKEIEDNFFRLIKAGFSSKRKYLLNNLFKNAIIQDRKYKKQETRNKKQTITNNQIINNQTNYSIHGKKQKIKSVEVRLQQQKILEIFEEIGLDKKVRAQELSLEQWINMAEKIGA